MIHSTAKPSLNLRQRQFRSRPRQTPSQSPATKAAKAWLSNSPTFPTPPLPNLQRSLRNRPGVAAATGDTPAAVREVVLTAVRTLVRPTAVEAASLVAHHGLADH